MTAQELGNAIGIMIGQAIKGFCFGLGALAALRLAAYWAGL